MNEPITSPTRCGFISILGRPNVGKSTLLNQILGKKISITSNKPQTTRHQLLGIKTKENTQMVYIDTPGIHQQTKTKMNQHLNKVARHSLIDVNLVLFLIESLKWTDEDELVLSFLKKVEKPVVLVINKVDKVNEKTRLLPFIQRLAEKYKFDEVILISAISGKNVDRLEKCIDSYLPEDHFYFPPAQISNRDLAFQASEIIREKIMRSLEREVPYSAMVQIEKLDETEKFIEICAVIWVEREGQKAILIGKQGNQLKEIGTHARQDMEAHLGQKVVLRLWVKVKKGWSDDASSLKELGIIEDR